MKLFCVVLVVYVVALTLFGVDGRGGGGGGSTKGLEEPVRLFVRTRRHVHTHKKGLESASAYVNNEQPPPPPPHLRPRRNTINLNNEPTQVTNEEPPPHTRQRRQMPSPPEGMPAPPDGVPAPPAGMPAPPA
ncbi:wiskott-Aldrich syndrome protein homolog 1-like [Drosophila novamexicana]|uniref:wiskott-Aldrich syndrome protein homolog 1 n=1 Tax=Drosophila novamexicana TaxID=47314 RepID=UPI0011E5A36B|nr:wiskott-Aldrich syndrome protein homolog 1 [Drosophila novamexicana]XP_030554540.1 wiskott-Aldrich syndrome protein homolog 1-like [Drosophila novamexicana]